MDAIVDSLRNRELLYEIKNCYEIYFDQYDKLTYRNVGVAMLPMLEPRKDLFTVQKKKKERCKKYDVILCRREETGMFFNVL